MKTTVKQITAGTFVALLLLVGNAEASEIKATRHKTVETTLQLESWMTNETIWNTNSLNIMEFAHESEAGLELESWMTNDESWSMNHMFVKETETGLELEGWMTNDATWNKVYKDKETELTVENWMLNSNIWE